MVDLGKTTGRYTVGVGLLSAGLLIGSGAWPASAAPTPRTIVSGSLTGTAAGSGSTGCKLEGANATRQARVGAGARTSTWADTSRSLRTAAGTEVGLLRTKLSGSVTPTMGRGGLSRIVAHGTGEATFYPTGAAATCGDAGGTMGTGKSTLSANSSQPVTSAGWLDFTMVNHNAANPTTFEAAVVGSDSTVRGALSPRRIVTRETARLFLPAGTVVYLWGHNTADVTARRPLAQAARDSFGFSYYGVVTPVGYAVSGQSGKYGPKRAVKLPSAVSCTYRKGAVTLTKYARKKARTVTLAVNGKTVKKVKKVRARTHLVRVPSQGAIRLKATVTFKNGKKRTTIRSYAACS